MPARAALLVVLLAIPLAACGGGRNDPERDGTTDARSSPSQDERAAVRTAVVAYLHGLTQGAGRAACGYLTPQVRATILKESSKRACEEAVPAYARAVDRRLRDRLAHVRITRTDVRGRRAGAVLVDPRSPLRVRHRLPLVHRGDRWLVAEAWAGYAPRQDLFEGCVQGSTEVLRTGNQGAFWRRQPSSAAHEFARRYCDAAERRGWLEGNAGFLGPQVQELAMQIARDMADEGLIDAPDPNTPVA